MEILIFLAPLFSLWMILGSITFIIALIFLVEHEYTIRSGIAVIGYILFLQFLMKIDIAGSIINNPLKYLIIGFVYLFIGFIWSLIKWGIYVEKKAMEYKEKRYEFLKTGDRFHKLQTDCTRVVSKSDITLETPIPESLIKEWKTFVNRYTSKIPIVHENKNKISNWMLYWPPSMMWSVLNDFIRNLANFIVIKIRFIYEWITKRAYKGIEEID